MPSVLICDDSATMRALLRWVLQAHGLRVAAETSSAEEAVALAQKIKPDLITMDVMLPGLDGFEATKAILKAGPARIVIVSAAAEALQADLVFRALQCGALDLVDKPEAGDQGVLQRWGKDLCENLLALCALPPGQPAAPIRRRDRPSLPPRRLTALGIVASTGGPPALAALLKDVPASLAFPILVAQHIAPGFTEGMARWLGTQTRMRVRVAQGGETAEGGTVWFPADRHDLLWQGGRLRVARNPGGLCPSGDRLLESLALELGPAAAGMVLTGMGADGAEGLLRLRGLGGLTFAQESASCVVDGMPSMAVARGGTQHRLTPDELGFCVAELGRHGGSPPPSSLLGPGGRP